MRDLEICNNQITDQIEGRTRLILKYDGFTATWYFYAPTDREYVIAVAWYLQAVKDKELSEEEIKTLQDTLLKPKKWSY